MANPTAKKSLGQHFLRDDNIIRKIIETIHPEKGETIIEIGPGPAALTKPLIESNAHIHAIELDNRMVEGLEALNADNLTIHHRDALKFDYTPYHNKNIKLVGNLPYNVGTQIVVQALKQPSGTFSSMVFMLQKEVILRIIAQPGTPDWGRLGILCHLWADCQRLFDVPPTAFAPPPKVMSSIVRLVPLATPRYPHNPQTLETILSKSFGQRRKMLRASLKGLITDDICEKCGILPTQRPEELSTKQFCKLSTSL